MGTMEATGKGCWVWVSFSFFLALRSGQSWADLGMVGAAYVVLLFISSS